MCLISSQPSSEAGIAQVLMRHLLLGTSEGVCEPLAQKGTDWPLLKAGGSAELTVVIGLKL